MAALRALTAFIAQALLLHLSHSPRTLAIGGRRLHGEWCWNGLAYSVTPIGPNACSLSAETNVDDDFAGWWWLSELNALAPKQDPPGPKIVLRGLAPSRTGGGPQPPEVCSDDFVQPKFVATTPGAGFAIWCVDTAFGGATKLGCCMGSLIEVRFAKNEAGVDYYEGRSCF